MEFVKTAKTHLEQLELLKSRGLIIENESSAIETLSKISYYRLRAYWLTFEEIPQNNIIHKFKPNVKFDNIIATYDFDRQLRHIVFNAIELIEIALRTQMIYHLTLTTQDNLWYTQQNNFKNEIQFQSFMQIFQNEYKKSNEVFIKHYQKKYSFPDFPPAWMALEILSLGQLSMLYRNLNLTTSKKQIASIFNISYVLLESWIESLSYIRNVCAHHGRLWNKILPKTPIYPNRIKPMWLSIKPTDDKINRLYIILSIIYLLLKEMNYHSEFKSALFNLIRCFPNIPLHYLGFPLNWANDEFWS